MANPLLQRTINDVLYGYQLSATYKSAWVYEQSYALSKDPDIWEVFLRDTSFASSVDRFQNSIVRPFRVEPPKGTKNTQSKRAARIVEDGIRQSMLFDDMRKRLSLGRALGRSYEFVIWDYVHCSLGGYPEMDWMVPIAFENIDRRRIHWVPEWGQEPDGTPKKRTHRELYNTNTNQWQPISPDFEDALIEDIYPVSEDRVGQGRGLLEHCYVYHYLKSVFIEKWAQGIDRWANGIVVGKIDTARPSSLAKAGSSLQSAMQAVLQKARSEHVIVTDKADEIEVVETSGTGHEMINSAMEYIDSSVERLWNGSVRPSGHATGTGARAQSETESDTSESFYQPYRQHQDEILTRDLVGYFWRHPVNKMNRFKLGLGMAERPHFSSEQVKRKDPLTAIQIVTAARQAGIPLLKSEVYEDLEYTQPEPDEDVFDGAMAMMGDEGGLDAAGAASGFRPQGGEAAKAKEDKDNKDLEMAEAAGASEGGDNKPFPKSKSGEDK